MPELPEVHTTVEGLKKVVIGQIIKDIWSDFHLNTKHKGKDTIKNKKYFDYFKQLVVGAKIISIERGGKNILIHIKKNHQGLTLEKYTIVIHMKMTGHLMVGEYQFRNSKTWIAVKEGPLQDSYNQFIHLVFSLSNNKHLVLSDMRKFASVVIFETNKLNEHKTLATLGPDALDKKLTAKRLFEIIHQKKKMPIKSALLDQSAIAGIGNIYSDEILWQTNIHPLSLAEKIPEKKFKEIFKVMRNILKLSIKHGGDSKSDYRNAFGEKGNFQNFHQVYGRKGEECPKKNCLGIIKRIVVKGRSSHFCPKHQILYK